MVILVNVGNLGQYWSFCESLSNAPPHLMQVTNRAWPAALIARRSGKIWFYNSHGSLQIPAQHGRERGFLRT